jgi:hypothetical protein
VNAPQARQDSEPQVAPIVAATVSTPKNGTDQVPTNVVNTSPTVQAADTAVAVTDSKYKSDDAVVSSGTVPVPAPAKAIVATAPVASIPIASTSVASTSVVSTPVVSTAVPIAPQARQDSEPQVVANDKVVSAPQAPPQNTEPQAEPMMSATVSTPGNGKAQAATSLASTSSTVQTAKAEVTATKSESNTDDEVTPVDTAPVPAPAPAVVASAPVANAPVVSQPQARQDAVPQVEPSLATAVVTPVNGKAQAVTLVANTASTAAAAKAEVTGTRSERKSDDAVASVDTAPVPTQAPALVASAPIVSAPQPQPDVEPQVESIVATDISTPVIGKAQAPKSVASTAAASGTAKTEVAGKKSDRKSDDAVASSDTTPVPAQAAATVAAVPVVSLTQVSQNTVPQAEATAANDVKIGSATAKTVPPVVKKSDSKPAAAATADAPVAAASVAPVLHDANVPTAAVTGVAQVTGNVAATTGHVAHGPVAANGTSTAKVSESEIQSSSSSSASLSSAASTPANSDLRTLVSTPNVLEIGFASGSHGWLKVRAELDGSGEVAASVVAATASAAEGLHKELPGLSQYLAGEHVAVSSLVVNATAKGADAQDVSTGAGSTGTQAGGRQGEGQSGSGNQAQTNSGVDAGVLSTGVWTDFESGFPGVQFPAPMLADANGSGSWLSVRV